MFLLSFYIKYKLIQQSSLIQVVEYHAQQASIRVEGGAEYVEKARELKIKGLKVKKINKI